MGLNYQKKWQEVLRQNFRDWEKLADFLELTPEQRNSISKNPSFSLNLPLRLANKIAKGTLNDPILRQFLPTIKEEEGTKGFIEDPVGDNDSKKSLKLLDKYHGRVLLVTTGVCALNCRYCFRQNFDYDTKDNTFVTELEIITQDPSIKEVILSGGDPLSLSNRTLKDLLERLDAITHLQRIRIHTRFPIAIPERLDEALIAILKNLRCKVWIVIHANHPNELDDEVLAALGELQRCGIIILNQSVLLRGVNDSVEVLAELCERLVNHGIVPYYLHQLDRVKGAAHFEVPEEQGAHLVAELAKRLPGYAVPKYVREDAGEPSKTLIS